MDDRLTDIEERITALYTNADNETRERFNSFLSNYQEQYQRKLAQLESGEITQEQYDVWCRNQLFRQNQFTNTLDTITDVLVNTDVAAMALVNDELPYVIADSFNFVQSLGFQAADDAGLTVGNFQIYNARSVQSLIRDNPQILPEVVRDEDYSWNRSRVNREITQSIIQGNSIPQVASRLQRVTGMDRNSAIRSARTAMTGAENMGRSESARHLRENGIPIDEVWSATMDSRTRDTHLLLDGTKANKDGFFGEGILDPKHLMKYPADPNGLPQEVYNCRCRLQVVLQGIDHSQDGELYERFMQENYPDDWAYQQKRDLETGRTARREEALERQRRLRRRRR